MKKAYFVSRKQKQKLKQIIKLFSEEVRSIYICIKREGGNQVKKKLEGRATGLVGSNTIKNR